VSPKERVYWIIIDFKHKPVSRLSMFSTGNTPIIGSFLTGGDHFDEFRDEDSIKTTRLNGFFGDRSSPWTISARGGLPSIDESMILSMDEPMSTEESVGFPVEDQYRRNKVPHRLKKY